MHDKTRSGSPRGPYAGQLAALATMHGKEQAIGPALEETLGLRLAVPGALDTDTLGTFTGEIDRPGNMLETARRKAQLGLKGSGLQLALASEGSYGPHPVIPFLPVGHELLLFIDAGRQLEIHEQMVARSTNFRHTEARAADELEGFLDKAGFPAHGLIVRPNSGARQNQVLFKGIVDADELARAMVESVAASDDGRARIETDMRAHMNPTRMQAIAELALRLGRRLATACGRCEMPGFGLQDVRKGLPCSLCGTPTELVVSEIMACAACDHREEQPRSDGLTAADPGQCPLCNP